MKTMLVGTRVRMLHGFGEGVITRIDGQKAVVLLNEGLEIPVPLGELVAVARKEEAKQLEKGSPVVKAKEAYRPGRPFFLEEGLFLAGTRGSRPEGFLINQSHRHVTGVVYRIGRPLNRFLCAFQLEPESAFSLPSGTEWKETPHETGLLIQWLAYHPESGNPTKPGEKRVEFRLLPPPGADTELPQVEKRGFILQLDGRGPEDVQPEVIRESLLSGPKEPSRKDSVAVRMEFREVDLHIERLVADPDVLSASDMLEIQLAAFEKNLDKALGEGLNRLILIHGTGNGVLKSTIRKRLGDHPLVTLFRDAPRERYGSGATEVIF